MSNQRCDCCGDALRLQWTDTHGVAVCIACGLPYRVYHYENDKRIDKAPEMCLTPEGLGIARRYWAERNRRVYPACFDMGILRGRASYSGATRDDCEEFNSWYEQAEVSR